MQIGILGKGFVGGAVCDFFQKKFIVRVYDKFKNIGSVYDLKETDVCFVSVPTPTVNGKQDLTAIFDVCESLNEIKYQGVIVIKSTVIPGTCASIYGSFQDLRIVHNPEFLTERNAVDDFENQKAILLSGHLEDVGPVIEVYDEAYDNKAVILSYPDWRITELAKYLHNTFLALKVGYMNEFSALCRTISADYDQVLEAAIAQDKIGSNHTKVPGPDSALGYGGTCFPKDVSSLCNFAVLMGADMPILKLCQIENAKRRPDISAHHLLGDSK